MLFVGRAFSVNTCNRPQATQKRSACGGCVSCGGGWDAWRLLMAPVHNP